MTLPLSLFQNEQLQRSAEYQPGVQPLERVSEQRCVLKEHRICGVLCRVLSELHSVFFINPAKAEETTCCLG
jgi:hypothetical protein